MYQTDFAEALEVELRDLGAEFDRAAVKAFVASAWPGIENDPDLSRWAAAFVDSGPAALPAVG